MIKSFITTSIITTSLLFAVPSFSAPIDFTDNTTYTTDTISGLDWLDVTASRHLSYDNVSAQFGAGGTFAGYRYATRSEFNTLINNYTGSSIPTDSVDPNIHDFTQLKNLVLLLGDTRLSSQNGTFATPAGAPYFATVGMLDSSDTWVLRSALAAWHFTSRSPQAKSRVNRGPARYGSGRTGTLMTKTYADVNAGSFLVRNTSVVPIPAAAFMFAPALLGFAALRRKKRAA